jgi:hypothetical protein
MDTAKNMLSNEDRVSIAFASKPNQRRRRYLPVSRDLNECRLIIHEGLRLKIDSTPFSPKHRFRRSESAR